MYKLRIDAERPTNRTVQNWGAAARPYRWQAPWKTHYQKMNEAILAIKNVGSSLYGQKIISIMAMKKSGKEEAFAFSSLAHCRLLSFFKSWMPRIENYDN
jgi:hypothetical protein